MDVHIQSNTAEFEVRGKWPTSRVSSNRADITVDKKKYAEVGELRKDASQPRHENVTS